MPGVQAVAFRRSTSGGALLALTIGLGLYQLSSLAVGSPSERFVPLSMQIPTIDVKPITGPIVSDVNLIIGTRIVVQRGSMTVSRPKGRLAPTSEPATLAKQAVTPLPTPVVATTTSLYHDADERSLRLARRR